MYGVVSVNPITTSRQWDLLTYSNRGTKNMTCFHPLIRIEYLNKKRKKAIDGHKYNDFSIEKSPKAKFEPFYLEDNTKGHITNKKQIIPCGHCIGCRLDYAREWANRGYLEAKYWKEIYGEKDQRSWFVTLTYDDEHLPRYKSEIRGKEEETDLGTLRPRDLQLFIKRLRKNLKQDGIRYMACGEYGEEGARPHYHIILFNCNLKPETFYKARLINNEIYWQNKEIEKAWIEEKKERELEETGESLGISCIGEANWNTINYTARYITKKINGKKSEEIYAQRKQEKEFMRVSRMGGIGRGYYEKYKDKIYKNDSIIVKNKSGVIESTPPEFFDKLYEKEQPEKLKEIKRKREKRAKDQEKMKKTSLSRLEQREIEERTKDQKTMQLIRAFEEKKKK